MCKRHSLPPLSDEAIRAVYGEPPQHGIRCLILVVLSCVEWADLTFVRTCSTFDLAPRPGMAEIADHLAWLAKQGYVRERHRKTRAFFWQQPREERFYALTPRGQSLYRETEARLQAGQLEFMMPWNPNVSIDTTEPGQQHARSHKRSLLSILLQGVWWAVVAGAVILLVASLLR